MLRERLNLFSSRKSRVTLAAVLSFSGATIFGHDGLQKRQVDTPVPYAQDKVAQNILPDAHTIPDTTQTEIYEHQDAKTCIEMGFRPDAIRGDGKDSTVFELGVGEACRNGLTKIKAILTRSFFSLGPGPGPVPIELKDDGLGKDRMAGDFIFTSGELIPITHFFRHEVEGEIVHAQIKGLHPALPLYRLKLVYQDGSEKRFRVPSLLVLDPTITQTDILRHQDAQFSPNIINIKDTGVISESLRAIEKEEEFESFIGNFYKLSKDDSYQFLTLTTSNMIILHPFNEFRNLWQGNARWTRRDFKGVGIEPHASTDKDRRLGSNGELRLIAVGLEPLIPYIAFHEWTHWIGVDLDTFGLSKGRHWKDTTSAGGILYGTNWVDNKDGTFTTKGRSFDKLSKLEQYLWGWIPPEQVPPIYVALNENQNFWASGPRIEGPFKTVTIQDIIDQHGVRNPGPDKALRNPKIGYLYTTKGRLATPIEMTARELIARRLIELWPQATDGQSTIEFVTPVPHILQPAEGATIPSLSLPLEFKVPPNTKQAHLQLIPFNNDGPGINLTIDDQRLIKNGKFTVSAVFGQGPYVALPDMDYTWRIKTTTSLETPDKIQDQDWSPWVERKFRTPTTSSETIRLGDLSGNQETKNLRPSLSWTNENQQVFYYEVQLSKDPTFNTDPKTARAAVYHNLVHGGFTNPPNSWTPPAQFSLEGNSRYYWRVRPRIQGDGTPVGWSAIGSFRTTIDRG